MMFFSFIIFILVALVQEPIGAEEIPSYMNLKIKQPNWRMEKILNPVDQTLEKVIFYEPTPNSDKETPVKEIIYAKDGRMVSENDLTKKELSSKDFVRHGPSITYDDRNHIQSIKYYNLGVLNGDSKEFYKNGTLKKRVHYKNGIKEGEFEEFYEDGKVKVKGSFKNNKLEGLVVTYLKSGQKKSSSEYQNGLLHGNVVTYFENGEIRSKKTYTLGLLHNLGKTRALIEYYPNKVIKETKDFLFGIPSGVHIKYHENGKESYKVTYNLGKKTGQELGFDEEGTLIQEGEFVDGKPVGRHIKKSQDTLIYIAEYDKKGTLLNPIEEFDSSNHKILEYFKDDFGFQGKFIEWYPNGNLKKEHNYVNGLYEGSQKEYYENGSLSLNCFYKNQKIDGLYEEWFENGLKKSECHYQNGIKKGLEVQYFSNGNKKKETSYDDTGRIDGEERRYSENGQLIFQGTFVHGLKTSLFQEWYPNGQVKRIANYLNDKLNGKEETFYENGQEKSKISYILDRIDGSLKTWFEEGSLHEEKQFVNSVPVGLHIDYYKKNPENNDQIIEREVRYTNGKLDGEQKSYYKNGQLQACLNYRSNVLHGKKAFFGLNGELLEEANYINGQLDGKYFAVKENGLEVIYHYKNDQLEGKHIVYYKKNGFFGKVKAYEATFKNGMLQGEAIEYNEAGTKISSIFYQNGKKQGPVTHYDHEGRVILASEYDQDVQHGMTYEYYPNGHLKREVLFVAGKKMGQEKFYDDTTDGKIILLKSYQNGLLSGLWQEWNPFGILIFEAEYKNGKKHGMLTKFDPQGAPILLHRYENDQLVEKFDL